MTLCKHRVSFLVMMMESDTNTHKKVVEKWHKIVVEKEDAFQIAAK